MRILTVGFRTIHDNRTVERNIGGLWKRSLINVLMLDVVFSAMILILNSALAASSSLAGAWLLTASCSFLMYLN